MKLSYNEFLNLHIKSLVDINILNNENHPKIPYVSSIKILTNNFNLSKISDIINYWKEQIDNNNNMINHINLNDINWMYVYCIKYGFLKNLEKININIYGSWEYTHRKYNLNINQADKYLSTLEKMSNEDINILLNEPININKNNILLDGTHRCCCMIGRIINGDKYINININYTD